MPRSSSLAAPFAWCYLLLPLGLLALAGCQPEDEKITSENSGYKVAGADDAPAAEGTRTPPNSRSRQEGSGSQAYRVTELEGGVAAEQSGIPAELLEIPEGDVQELLAYFDRLSNYQPDIQSREQALEFATQLMPLRAEVARRILEKEVPEQRRVEILDARIDALRFMSIIPMEGAQEELDAYLVELAGSDDPNLVQRSEVAQYQIQLDRILNQESTDAAGVLDSLQALLAKYELNRELYRQVLPTLNYLENSQFRREALQASRIIGEAFRHSDEPAVASEAQQMLAAGLVSLLVTEGDKASATAVAEYAQELLASEKLTPNMFMGIIQMSQALESTANLEESLLLYTDCKQIAAAREDLDPDGENQVLLDRSIERIEVSLGELGQPIELTGKLASGEPFDWGPYEGKVVLVDFWATWCTPCLMQMQTINQLRTTYEDLGFAVLGVNLDSDTAELAAFLSETPLPWANLIAADPADQGPESDPNAVRYHVDALPYALLVDRQGNIALVNPRGEGLRRAIERLLEQPAAEEPAAEQPAAEEPTAEEQPAAEEAAEPAAAAGARNGLPHRERMHFIAFQGDAVAGEEAAGETEATDPPAGEEPTTGEAPAEPATPDRSLLPPELQEIPSESPEELLAFFQVLIDHQPQVTTQAQAVAYMEQLMPLHAETAALILAGEATAEQRQQAVKMRLDALRLLTMLEQEGAAAELQAFVTSLADSDDPAEASRGRVAQFQLKLDALLTGQSEDPAPVLEQLESILSDTELTRDLYGIVYVTPQYLSGGGYLDEASQAELLVAEAFANHEDPEVFSSVRATFTNRAIRSMQNDGDQAAANAAVAHVEKVLSDESLTPEHLTIAILVAQALESTAFHQEAQHVYQSAQQAVADHAANEELDPEGEANKLIESSLERVEVALASLGQPVELEGELADGTPFAWDNYQGQVVLVDFWATWCEPCLMEMRDLMELQNTYQEQGFTVLGVNLDEDPQQVRTLLTQVDFPWPNLVAASEEVAGMENDPNALRYHVDALPFKMLIDRQGNISLINARGERLITEIEQLLAEPMPAGTEDPAAEDSAAEDPAVEDAAAEDPAAEETPPVAPAEPAAQEEPSSEQATADQETAAAEEPPIDLGPEQVTQAPPLARPPTPDELYSRLPEEFRGVPAGTTAERLEFFEQVQEFQAIVDQQGQAALPLMEQFLPLRLELCEKLLEEELPEEQRLEVLDFHIETLRFLRAYQIEDTTEQLGELAETLASSELPAETNRAGWIRYLLTVDALRTSEVADASVIVKQLTTLLESQEPTLELYYIVQGTPRFLELLEFEDEAGQAQEIIGVAFLESTDQQIVQSVAFDLIQHSFEQLLDSGDHEVAEKLLRAANAMLGLENLGPRDWSVVLQVAEALEYTGNIEQSGQLAQAMEKAISNLPAPPPQEVPFRAALGERVSSLQASLEISLGMLGNPFTLEGEYLNGESFDWESYRGKPVLVTYWSTEDEVSLEDIPDVNELYHDYHQQGFAVLGVNLDTDRTVAERHLARSPTLWNSVVSATPDLTGLEDPNATRYNVTLPYAVLIDQEGNVVMVQARGAKLEQKLQELLGLNDEQPAEEAAEEATAPAAAAGARRQAVEQVWFVSMIDDSAEEAAEVAETTPLAEPAEPGTVPLEQEPLEELEAEPTEEGETLDPFDTSINPYSPPPGMSKLELMEYILDMTARPVSIQSRPGFNAGVVAACEDLLAQEPTGRALLLAHKTRLEFLHRDAGRGDEEAQLRLVELAEECSANMPENADDELKAQVAFYLIEARALEVDDLSEEELPTLLADVKTFMQGRSLNETHLRLASQTVRAINRLPEEEREAYFEEFGGMWGESDDPQLARYGRRIGSPADQPGAPPAQVGQLLAGTGVATDGTALDLSAYRGQVLIVDFWATWCGPCVAELPNVQATYRELHEEGLELVGISLDEDMEALSGFLAEHALPWPTMAGKEGMAIARTYGVQAIPTMMLIDREGKIVAVAHSIGPLKEQAIALLEAPAEEAAPAE